MYSGSERKRYLKMESKINNLFILYLSIYIDTLRIGRQTEIYSIHTRKDDDDNNDNDEDDEKI